MNRSALRRHIVRGTAATFAGNAWAMVVSLITLPVLLHSLGAEQFGLWALIQTLSAVTGWASLVHAGPGTAVTRAVAAADGVGERGQRGRSLGSGIALLAGCAVAVGTLLAVLGPAVLPRIFAIGAGYAGEFRTAILIFAVQVAAEAMTEGVESCLEGLQRVDLSRAIDAVRRTFAAGLACSAAVTGHGLVGVAAAACTGTAIGLVAALAVMAWVARRDQLVVSVAEMKGLLLASRSIAMLRPLGVMERTLDRLVVGIMLGPAAVAVVEVATQVANGAAGILSASAYAVLPASSWLSARSDASGLRTLLVRGTRFSAQITLPVIVLAAIVCAPALRLWVGSDAAWAPTLVALSTIALVVPLQVGSELLVGTGRAGSVLRAAAAALAVNVIATVALVHVVGVTGAFLGTVAAEIVLIPLLAGAFLGVVQQTPLKFVRTVLASTVAPVLALAGAAVAISRLPIADVATVAAAGVTGAGAYTTLLLLARARTGAPARPLRQMFSER